MRNALLVVLAASLVSAAPGRVTLPPGFTFETVAGGLTGATALDIAPDGRVFVCEQTGALRVVKDGRLLDRPFLTLKVDSFWERGLIGVALDPDFAANQFVYVNYVTPDPYPHHRISRFRAEGDAAAEGSEVVLFEGDDQRQVNGSYPAGHQGGAIHFGKDGRLYVAIGEQTAGAPSQDMNSLLGKMLRLNPDGSIPEDNPFFQTARGKYRAIWALGLRNPFTFAVQPGTGRIYINDVGGNAEEINEGFPGANYGWPSIEHGPTKDARFRGPVYHYPTSSITGGDFCGHRYASGPGAHAFPSAYQGRYFFPDFMKGWIRTLDPDRPSEAVEFATGLPRPVDMRFGPDGSLYVLLRDMWVKDKDFRPGTGSLAKIAYDPNSPAPKELALPEPPPTPIPPIAPDGGTYTGPIAVRLHFGVGLPIRYTTDGSEPSAASRLYDRPIRLTASTTIRARPFRDGEPAGTVASASYRIEGDSPYGMNDRDYFEKYPAPLDPGKLPKRLSETGLFASLGDLTPAPGVIPYAVNAPLWSDGAEKRRWVALPGGDRIGFHPTGEWAFPRGATFIKHFELPLDETEDGPRRRLETRLLVADGAGGGYGVTYRWRPDGSDADLLMEGRDEAIAGRTWTYPSREDCLRCHTAVAGFVLGPKTRQLNGDFNYAATGIRDNQIRTWKALGMFASAIDEGEIPGLDRLVSLDDDSAPVEQRVRSYLDANCMHCHRPGANIPAAFDARYDTPLPAQGMIDARTVSDSLGIDRPRVVAPGDLGRSMLYQRLIQSERYKMPPLARNRVDDRAAEVVRHWIEGLK